MSKDDVIAYYAHKISSFCSEQDSCINCIFHTVINGSSGFCRLKINHPDKWFSEVLDENNDTNQL